MEYEGYCVKCKQKRAVTKGAVSMTSNGRPIAKGPCPVCGTTVARFLSKVDAAKHGH